MKIGWNKIVGQKIPNISQTNEIISIDDENLEIDTEAPFKKTCRSNMSPVNSPSHGYAITECNELQKQCSQTNNHTYTPTTWLRNKPQINYAPIYHQLDDAPLPASVMNIPFPKKNLKDNTARGDLLVAPSRIGDIMGVYTIGSIPQDAIIMDFVVMKQWRYSQKKI